jgi:hypothetical protein
MPVPTRDFAVATAVNPYQATKLLLDGQQRLTSLAAIIRGEPVTVRGRRRRIELLFDLEHPDGLLVVTEVNEDSDDPRYEKYTQRLARLPSIRRYSYRIDVLERCLSYDEVTEIFVRVNSFGAHERPQESQGASASLRGTAGAGIVRRSPGRSAMPDPRPWHVLRETGFSRS